MKFLAPLFFSLLSFCAFAGENAPPNFIFVLVDDLGQQVGCGIRSQSL